MDSALSIKNASGKTFSLLNDSNSNSKSTFKVNKLTSATMSSPVAPKRKYHCSEPGCNKSFTTSGHLARHNRIHTGEKNFTCLHPGCPSRFSRQDNMMQHYRTHLSQKFRRHQMRHQQEKKGIKDDEEIFHQRPQLYSHSYHGRENDMSLQPLMTRPRRSVTMPSLPYPGMIQPKVANRPRRALSTSSTCSSSSSSSFSCSPPPFYENHHQQHYHHHLKQPQLHPTILPPPMPFIRHSHSSSPMVHQEEHRPHQQNEWAPNSQKSLSSLLQLANIVSTFG